MTETHPVTWFSPRPPHRPVDGTMFLRTDQAPAYLARAEANPNPKLSAAEAELRHWASGASCHITPEAVQIVLDEYDRRSTGQAT